MIDQERYSRHLSLPEIGERGQERLSYARVLVIGAGGLGSPALLYLTAAGVGTIGIIDDDRVDRSNLQRQILLGESSVGDLKTEASRARLLDLNPSINVRLHSDRLTRENALDLFRDYDLVLDGSDNFATRYLANDAAVIAGIPLISGSISRFDGQVTVLATADGPCYRCLFSEMPDPDAVPSCAEAGVLGVLPGVIGSVMATEAIKLICHIGEPLVGRLLTYDALALRFSEFRFERDPNCPMCGDGARKQLAESYEFACAPRSIEISGEELLALLEREPDAKLIDVREEWEVKSTPSRGLHIPLRSIGELELPGNGTVIFLCASGVRSRKAAESFVERGHARVRTLTGGLHRNPQFIAGAGS